MPVEQANGELQLLVKGCFRRLQHSIQRQISRVLGDLQVTVRVEGDTTGGASEAGCRVVALTSHYDIQAPFIPTPLPLPSEPEYSLEESFMTRCFTCKHG